MTAAMDIEQLRTQARSWSSIDPDPATRAEIEHMLEHDDVDGLERCFGARIEFGTAGMRGPLGPGPNRMNRLVVRQTAAGLARHAGPGALVVIGRDARHGSDEFADDSAAVCAAAGCEVVLLDRPVTTPVLAFAVTRFEADLGVMITASHNPPADNGYKMYGSDGIQIVPPVDVEVQAAINDVLVEGGDPPLVAADDPRIGYAEVSLETGIAAAYVDAVVRQLRNTDARAVRVVQTSLHGVADELFRGSCREAGFDDVLTVAEQAKPDPDFPTLTFPNPEEPSAIRHALSLATANDADVVLANDPDGDRLGVAVPLGEEWVQLTGDQIGVLLGDHLLRATNGSSRLVSRSVVSSRLLVKLAEAHAVQHAETLTGTKWIARPALARPDLRFVFGYEQALGYLIGREILEKDGIAAGLVFAELVAELRRDGRSVHDRLAELWVEHGLHHNGQLAIRLEGPHPERARDELMQRLRATAPERLDGRRVIGVRDLLDDPDLPRSDVLILSLTDDSWLAVRPSGTEPKVKVYGELVRPLDSVSDASAELADMNHEMNRLLGSISTLL